MEMRSEGMALSRTGRIEPREKDRGRLKLGRGGIDYPGLAARSRRVRGQDHHHSKNACTHDALQQGRRGAGLPALRAVMAGTCGFWRMMTSSA
jgi:hypothetical protein